MATEFMEAEEVVKSAKPGDLIEFQRRLYKHWGIYIGGGDIVHFGSGSTNQDKSLVKHEKLTKVADSDLCRVNNRLDDTYPRRDPNLVVKDALQMVGQRVKYSLVSCNCEHFVTWLRYNISESGQVEDAIVKALVGGTIVILGAALGVAVSLARNQEESDETG